MPPHGVPPQQQQQQIQQQPPAGGGGGVGLPPPPKAMRGQPMPQHMQGSFDGQQQHPHPPHLIIQVTTRQSSSFNNRLVEVNAHALFVSSSKKKSFSNLTLPVHRRQLVNKILQVVNKKFSSGVDIAIYSNIKPLPEKTMKKHQIQ